MDNMDKQDKPVNLFHEFPPVSTSQWEEKIQQDLKGADYEKKLIWKTAEGFKVKPYYRSEDLQNLKPMLSSLPGQFPFVRGTENGPKDWLVAQDIEFSDTIKASETGRDATERGADALIFNASHVRSGADVTTILTGISTEKTFVGFNSAASYTAHAEYLKEALGEDMRKLRGMLDFDPLSYVLTNGNFYRTEQEDLAEGADLLKVASGTKDLKVISVNGQIFHNAGSTLTQELAYALAAGNEYLAWYTQNGFTAQEVASRMVFHFAVGGNYFMEIAKLRAARLLWARIVEQYEPATTDACRMFIHASTASWNKTMYDPYVNMLRTTTETMSAAIGQADIISVLPFDLTYQDPDQFSMRIARNQQIILKEESSLNKVADPAAGSYYIENLTASLADAAWKLFLGVEDMGGMLEAIKQGFIQDQVSQSARQKTEDIANRRTLILGTNQHPNTKEQMLEKIQMEEDSFDETIESEPFRKPVYKTLEIFRGSDAFEDLRLATEIWEDAGNKRPSVFMLTIGNPAMRKARAAFSAGFFGCAGYTIIDNTGFADAQQGIEAALASDAEIIVICSSDEEYAEVAPVIARAVKAADATKLVVVAGYPKEIIEPLKESGVDEFIHVKSNALDILAGFQKKLEIIL